MISFYISPSFFEINCICSEIEGCSCNFVDCILLWDLDIVPCLVGENILSIAFLTEFLFPVICVSYFTSSDTSIDEDSSLLLASFLCYIKKFLTSTYFLYSCCLTFKLIVIYWALIPSFTAIASFFIIILSISMCFCSIFIF
jgi:hypothetical protein